MADLCPLLCHLLSYLYCTKAGEIVGRHTCAWAIQKPEALLEAEAGKALAECIEQAVQLLLVRLDLAQNLHDLGAKRWVRAGHVILDAHAQHVLRLVRP